MTPSNLIIDEKYFNLEIDHRFPLYIPIEKWQTFTKKGFKRPKKTFIYLIKCLQHLYVGSDKNGQRIITHVCTLRNNYHNNNFMQNVFNKYGEENFYYFPLVEIPEEFVKYRDQIENSYIKLFNTFNRKNPNGFNLVEFADTPLLGWVFSEEHKAKISAALKGKEKSKEHLINMGEARAKNYTFINPDGKQIDIHNLAQFCKERDLDSGAMIKVSHGETYHHKNWTHINSKVKEEHSLIDPDGKIYYFTHMSNFCKEHGLHFTVISQVLNDKQPHHKGWKKNN